MKKIFYFLVLVISGIVPSMAQQGINNNWLMGYESWGGLPFGQTRLDFFNGTPVISYDSIEMDFNHTHANISDAQGNMLFYTNGYYIADASNDTMQNGSGINPGAYANMFKDGLLIPQGALAMRKPGSNNIYYLFHGTADDTPYHTMAFHLYLTTIDISMNNGKGAVISKNQILINDSLNAGKIAACKHANGRDWWVMVHRANSNMFYKLLITPNVILGPYSQNIGTVRTPDAGQAKFSPDGTKYAYYFFTQGLDIFDFNRCTGQLSNVQSDYQLPNVPVNVGCEFSPNSNVLYVSEVKWVFQYDLLASNIIASRTTVAVYDSFFQPGDPVLGTYFCNQQLAPDGKIYITTGNGTTYLHTIDNPDVVGMGCNVNQHSVQVAAYYFNTVPNHPNYFLGCDSTLGCLCASTVNLNDPHPPEGSLKAMPNPTDGVFTLQFNVMSISGELEIYDVMGRLVYKDYVSAWSQFKKVDISNMPKGIYFCKIIRKEKSESVKVVKE
ncbi:MAG: T9SS type A sorting domain-containing protein [Bacteroidetes bacterium]|nr:T9SS type A sorting domain-containing protein [Bacteroidota bacterium]